LFLLIYFDASIILIVTQTIIHIIRIKLPRAAILGVHPCALMWVVYGPSFLINAPGIELSRLLLGLTDAIMNVSIFGGPLRLYGWVFIALIAQMSFVLQLLWWFLGSVMFLWLVVCSSGLCRARVYTCVQPWWLHRFCRLLLRPSGWLLSFHFLLFGLIIL